MVYCGQHQETFGIVHRSHSRNRQPAVPTQTLAYLLPTLSLAIARAEAEVEAAAAAAATLSRWNIALGDCAASYTCSLPQSRCCCGAWLEASVTSCSPPYRHATASIQNVPRVATLKPPASRRQKRTGAAPPVGSVQAVVVAPSRELAMQIVRVAQSLLPPGARGAVQQCIGGANPHRQVRSLSWVMLEIEHGTHSSVIKHRPEVHSGRV